MKKTGKWEKEDFYWKIIGAVGSSNSNSRGYRPIFSKFFALLPTPSPRSRGIRLRKVMVSNAHSFPAIHVIYGWCTNFEPQISREHKSLQSSTFYPRIPDIWTWPQYQVKYLSGEQTAWRHLWAHDQKQTCLRAHAVIGPFTLSESEIFLWSLPLLDVNSKMDFLRTHPEATSLLCSPSLRANVLLKFTGSE